MKEADQRHPDARFKDHFRNDYKKFRRLWKTKEGEPLSDRREAEYYFPFRLAQTSAALKGPLSPLAGKYYHQVIEEQIDVGEGQETVGNVFGGSSDYKIPLIEYLDASPKQIHEVFHLYNRQGKHLNAEEIRNALFHDVDLVRLVLAASGDNSALGDLAPYIPSTDHTLLRELSKCLDDYRFGNARYKRTKVLSWLFALLFQPSESGGVLTIRSTAKQIDALLGSVRENPGHRMSDQLVLRQLVRDAHRCMEAHSSADCWAPRFKDDETGSKWQELQLVASLVGVFLIGVLESSPSEVLDRSRLALLDFTKDHRRPEKTQNKTQWAFIGEVALGILKVVGMNEERLDATLMSRYGVSCLPTLRAAKATYKPRPAD